MFAYFPDNYMWSLSFLRALGSGALLGELDRIGTRLTPAASVEPSGDLEAWHREWLGLAEEIGSRGAQARTQGRLITAHDNYFRATHYFQWAEAFLTPGDPRKIPTYKRHLDCFRAAMSLSPDRTEIVEVPYVGTSLPAYFIPAADSASPAPAVVYFGGLDSCKEELYGLAKQLARRGLSCLVADGPGQAEALKLRGLRTRFDYEVPAGAAYEYLAARPDVDAARIGLMGASMGGYYAARAAAFEKRFCCAVAFGGQYDYRQTWVRRLEIRPGSPLAAPAHHLFEVLGATSWDEALERLGPFTLQGVAGNIECPFLIVHGENDRQALLQDAKALYDEAGSTQKELRVFTELEGGSAHCQIDCPEPGHSYVADWLARQLGGAPEESAHNATEGEN